jgi:hypothetical protein
MDRFLPASSIRSCRWPHIPWSAVLGCTHRGHGFVSCFARLRSSDRAAACWLAARLRVLRGLLANCVSLEGHRNYRLDSSCSIAGSSDRTCIGPSGVFTLAAPTLLRSTRQVASLPYARRVATLGGFFLRFQKKAFRGRSSFTMPTHSRKHCRTESAWLVLRRRLFTAAAIIVVGCGRSGSDDPPINAASNAPESAAPAVVEAATNYGCFASGAKKTDRARAQEMNVRGLHGAYKEV